MLAGITEEVEMFVAPVDRAVDKSRKVICEGVVNQLIFSWKHTYQLAVCCHSHTHCCYANTSGLAVYPTGT